MIPSISDSSQLLLFLLLLSCFCFVAEESLKQLEEREHYAVILLMITAEGSADNSVRQSASILFKNFLSRKYHEVGALSDTDRAEVCRYYCLQWKWAMDFVYKSCHGGDGRNFSFFVRIFPD